MNNHDGSPGELQAQFVPGCLLRKLSKFVIDGTCIVQGRWEYLVEKAFRVLKNGRDRLTYHESDIPNLTDERYRVSLVGEKSRIWWLRWSLLNLSRPLCNEIRKIIDFLLESRRKSIQWKRWCKKSTRQKNQDALIWWRIQYCLYPCYDSLGIWLRRLQQPCPCLAMTITGPACN